MGDSGGLRLRKPETKERIRWVVYGAEGLGKTTFAASLPGAVILDLEDGAGALDVPQVVGIDTARDLTEQATLAAAQFDTVVFDSAEKLEELLTAELLKKNGWKSLEAPGYGRGPKELAAAWLRFLSWLNSLDANVVIVAHANMINVRPPDSEAYHCWDLACDPKSANAIRAWAHAVLFMHRSTVLTGKDDAKRAVGIGPVMIHTAMDPAWRAKNRVGMPPTVERSEEAPRLLWGIQTQTPREALLALVEGKHKAAEAIKWFDGQIDKHRALAKLKERFSK